jgi:ribosomal protein L30
MNTYPLQKQFIDSIVKVTLVRSSWRTRAWVKLNLKALGLQRINQHRYLPNSADIRGKILVVCWLFDVFVVFCLTVLCAFYVCVCLLKDDRNEYHGNVRCNHFIHYTFR